MSFKHEFLGGFYAAIAVLINVITRTFDWLALEFQMERPADGIHDSCNCWSSLTSLALFVALWRQ